MRGLFEQLDNTSLELQPGYGSDLQAKVAQQASQVVLRIENLRLHELPRSEQHPDLLAPDGLDMNRLVEADAHHLRDAAGIVAIGFVDLSRERGLHVPRLDADHRIACGRQATVEPLRKRTGFKADALVGTANRMKQGADRLRLGLHLALSNKFTTSVHHTHAGGANGNIKTHEQFHGRPPDRLNRWSLPGRPTSRYSHAGRSPEPQSSDLFCYPNGRVAGANHYFSHRRNTEIDL